MSMFRKCEQSLAPFNMLPPHSFFQITCCRTGAQGLPGSYSVVFTRFLWRVLQYLDVIQEALKLSRDACGPVEVGIKESFLGHLFLPKFRPEAPSKFSNISYFIGDLGAP